MSSPDVKPLAQPEFWDGFWKSIKLPLLPDPSKRYERCFLDLFDRFFAPDPSMTIFEAGCAPGMWLSYFHKRFGYKPYGCDTSAQGLALTRENFRLCGVPGRVDAVDFLAYRPDVPFDAVISLGFIEHFEEPDAVLDKHLELLKPGGTLVLEVPNLVGLNAWLVTPELRALHNESVMNRAFFERFAARTGVETLYLDYIGGFEPDNLGPSRNAWHKRAVLKVLRLLCRVPGVTSINSPLVSGFLIGVFRKPA